MDRSEDLINIMRTRRSVRRFTKDPIERETIVALVEAACWAPSASNRQDWRFTVVASPEKRRMMADAVRRSWECIVEKSRELGFAEHLETYGAGFADFEFAPVVMLISALKPQAVQIRLLGEDASAAGGSTISAAMAAQNLLLMAHAKGLGACCMTGALIAQNEIARLAGLDGGREIVCLVALGRPAEEPPAPSRKPPDSVMEFVV